MDSSKKIDENLQVQDNYNCMLLRSIQLGLVFVLVAIFCHFAFYSDALIVLYASFTTDPF